MSYGEERKVRLPMGRSLREELRAGEMLRLSGRLLTARDRAHRRIVEELDRGNLPPLRLKDEVILYAGPTPPPPGAACGSIGPTTSARLDLFTPRLVEEGVAAFIGKGPRSPRVRASMVKGGSLYLVAVGGVAALLGSRVRSLRVLLYPELGPEAVYEVVVEDFPVMVGYDLHGGDVFSHLP